MTDRTVLIVGAGPTGLVLALWLTRLGVAVRIIDKTAEPGTTSRALGVQARTLELYQQVGLAEEVVAGSVAVEGVNLWVKGHKAVRIPLHEMGTGLSPFPHVYMYAQDVHERMLIEHLDALGVQVERRTELVRFEQDANGVHAILKPPDDSEETYEAAYLAGCDGAHSTVRQTLGIGFPGGTYTGVFYVADVNASGPAVNEEVHLELEESDFLAVFPLKGPGNVRLIGAVSWDPEVMKRDLTFNDISPRAMKNLGLTIEEVNWFSTYRVHHRVAERFHVGRAFLLGDAAHIHSPAGGQGMNTGIGDAINLAWKLAAVLKDEANEDLLHTHELERIGFARRLVATTDRVFMLVTRQGPFARIVRTRIAPRVFGILFRQNWFRRFMFRTISQITISYRKSPLSAGVAGSIHGGDRLPWVEVEPEKDNFSPLTSLAWQVHVYGEASPTLVARCEELALPLHAFPWRPEMQRAGLRRSALYLIRPDGYVALADPTADPDRLTAYFQGLGKREKSI